MKKATKWAGEKTPREKKNPTKRDSRKKRYDRKRQTSKGNGKAEGTGRTEWSTEEAEQTLTREGSTAPCKPKTEQARACQKARALEQT